MKEINTTNLKEVRLNMCKHTHFIIDASGARCAECGMKISEIEEMEEEDE